MALNGDHQKADRKPIQEQMRELLADGQPHTRAELHACLWDEEGPMKNIQPHITFLRKTLRPKGEEILCELRGYSICYRHVKLLDAAVSSAHKR